MTAAPGGGVWPLCSRCGVRSPDVRLRPIHYGQHLLVRGRRLRRRPRRGLFCDRCAEGRPLSEGGAKRVMGSSENDLRVFHSLTDKRAGLSGEQVIAVLEMTHEKRFELLAELVEQAHADALRQDRRKK